MPKKNLAKYRAKRDFKKTPEPSGTGEISAAEYPRFVVQKHAATRLHYDLRLEHGGTFKSWAVTRGPSLDPKDKRLAVEVEDHPLDYGDFEGTIPKGEYGGGTVMVWDYGTYRNLKVTDGKEMPLAEAIAKGHVMVWLDGRKLKGGYSLIRTGSGEKARWLLVKMADDAAEPGLDITAAMPDSAQTGRSLEAITAAG
jgi:DNA ligase D-like protein (predicted 3'-phosphoesterase)